MTGMLFVTLSVWIVWRGSSFAFGRATKRPMASVSTNAVPLEAADSLRCHADFSAALTGVQDGIRSAMEREARLTGWCRAG